MMNKNTYTLTEYIAERGDEECANLFGVKVRTAASWRRDERKPKPEKANFIVTQTNGLVSMAGIYNAPQ